MEIKRIKEYYDNQTKRKIEDFINGNQRVERAFEEIKTWFVNNPENVFEIGCGIGSVAYRLSQLFQKVNFKGFDISPKSIEIANRLFKNPNLEYYCSDDIKNLGNHFDQYFDIIYLIDVFEHLLDEPRDSVIHFIKTRLAKNGIVFMSCPTPSHQEWLRSHKPDDLQPVDLDIHLITLMEFSEQIGRRILYFKEIKVWNEGDYFHVIFGNESLANRVLSNNLEEKTGIKKAFSNRVNSFLKKNKKDKIKRERLVAEAFSDFRVN